MKANCWMNCVAQVCDRPARDGNDAMARFIPHMLFASALIAPLPLQAMTGKPAYPAARDNSKQAAIVAADRDFQAMDGNKDGKVTPAELNDFIVRQNPGINPENRQKLVDMVLLRLDQDRSGTINRAEVIRGSLAQSGAR